MPNLTITNIDGGSVEDGDNEYRDEILTLAAADTVLAGTILARREVDTAVVVAADVTNTGDGTVTAASVIAGLIVPLVGAYNLECVEAVTNGGVFKLEDPNSAILANDLAMAAGAGGVTVFYSNGMTFTITDDTTDFIVGDKFSLTVAVDGDVVLFAVDGVGGAQKPLMVLGRQYVSTASGSFAVRPIRAGRVKKERLVIDGTAANVGLTKAILDALNDNKITPIDTQQLSVLDNQ